MIKSGVKKDMSRFCVIDIGSTTTKAKLFAWKDRWQFCRYESPTTVEKPHEDVMIGVANALQGLSQVSGTALVENGKPTIPCFATSSAGGGLAVVVAGLVRDVTARSGERVARGAGAIIQDVIALDDGRSPYRKIELLRTLRPDMVLLAGGFDGGAVYGPVFMSELLVQSGLRPKLSDDIRLPVIYAGNADARGYVRETLSDAFSYFEVPNLRPASNIENLDPAREALHDTFLNHVMSQALGYEKLSDLVDAQVIPTPSAVERLLKLISEEMGKRILAIDIGGATTDVFTAVEGKVVRTVSANLGMSYSILNVAEQVGIDTVTHRVGPTADPMDLYNRIGNKHLNPTSLPGTRDDVTLECVMASLAISEAVNEHLGILRGETISMSAEDLGWSRLKSLVKSRKMRFSEQLLSNYDLVIGSGGILSHSPRCAAAMILVNALQPVGTMDIAIDNAFMFPHLGVLTQFDPQLAMEILKDIGLIRLGKLIAPWGKSPREKAVLSLSSGEAFREVKGGRVEWIESSEIGGKRTKVKCRRMKLDVKSVTVDSETPAIVADTRGRPIEGKYDCGLPDDHVPEAREMSTDDDTRIHRGEITTVRRLAVPGEALVSVGDEVDSDSVVAKSVREFPRPFFINIPKRLNMSPEEARQHILIAVGGKVRVNDIVAEHETVMKRRIVKSPVKGTIEKLLPNGVMVIREEIEQVEGHTTVNVAEELLIRPESLAPYVKVSVGQEVERDQWLAEYRAPSGARKTCISPMRGRVREINLKYGIIIIDPIREELQLRAWLPGRVESTSDRGCTISSHGYVIRGLWGNGGESSGILTDEIEDAGAPQIVLSGHADRDMIISCVEAKVSGLISSTLEFVACIQINPPFPVIVLSRFGESHEADNQYELLASNIGRFVAMNASTQLRAGVVRPTILVVNHATD